MAARKPAASKASHALVDALLGAADRIVVRGIQSEIGGHARAFVERAAQEMVFTEKGKGAWEKLAESEREVWVSRAATALSFLQREVTSLFRTKR